MQFARISTFAGEEKEEEVIFHPVKQTNRDENGHISLKKGERERKYKGECDETRTEKKKKNRPTKKDEGKMPKIPERKIKMGKVVLKQDSRDRKTKGHHGKAKGQNQKASIHKQAKQIVFLSLPHSIQKYKPTFSPNVPTFRDFLPCFISNLPTPHKIHSILRAGHAPTRTYALTLSANFPFLPSPFTSPRNKLYISRLRVKTNPAYTFTATI